MTKELQELQTRWNPTPYRVVGKMANLPVYKLRPENGKGSVKTVHRDHILPIGQLVRLPKAEAETDSCVRARTRTGTSRTQTLPSPDTQTVLPEPLSTDSSSDSEYYRPTRTCYKLRETPRTRPTTVLSEDMQEDVDPPWSEESSEEDDNVEEGPSPDATLETGGDLEETGKEGSEEPEAEPNVRQDDSALKSVEVDASETTEPLINKNEIRSKRTIKPVVKRTYDEPGKARDQPITIIHRGVVIKIGKN